MKSLFADYQKEREGIETIETEKGFISYKVEFPNCEIIDCYTKRGLRESGIATFLANQVFEICKDAGVVSVFCRTDDQASGVDISKKAIERFGFKFFKKKENITLFKMEVAEWENQ
jgi:hypothetical protein